MLKLVNRKDIEPPEKQAHPMHEWANEEGNQAYAVFNEKAEMWTVAFNNITVEDGPHKFRSLDECDKFVREHVE